MIAKISKGTGFRGVLNYAFDMENENAKTAKLVNSNMLAKTPKELAREFGVVRNLRPFLKKAVMHVAFSAAHADTEKMTNEMFINIANDYMAEMGFDDNQFVLVRHNDTDHEHCHLVINRIKMADGSVVSDKNDQRRALSIMRKVEEKYGLTKVNSEKPAKRHPKKRELEMMRRTGEPSERMKLLQRLDIAISESENLSEYLYKLKALKIRASITLQNNKSKISGIAYMFNGIYFKASNLGQNYTIKNLTKKGLEYDKQNHLATIQELGFDNEQTRTSDNTNTNQTNEGHRAGNVRSQTENTAVNASFNRGNATVNVEYERHDARINENGGTREWPNTGNKQAVLSIATRFTKNPQNAFTSKESGSIAEARDKNPVDLTNGNGGFDISNLRSQSSVVDNAYANNDTRLSSDGENNPKKHARFRR